MLESESFLESQIQNPMNDSADIQIRFFKAKKDLTTAAATYSIEVASMEMGKGTDCWSFCCYFFNEYFDFQMPTLANILDTLHS